MKTELQFGSVWGSLRATKRNARVPHTPITGSKTTIISMPNGI